MTWTEAVTYFIELSTFGSVWFWLAIVVSWAVACHWLIGVPFDVLVHARRGSQSHMEDLEQLVRINVRRIVWFYDVAGTGSAALVAFLVSGIALLAVGYRFEFAQGLLILVGPLLVVAAMNVRLAFELSRAPLTGDALVARLLRVRLWTQVIAVATLFAVSVYGMVFNISSLYLF